MEKRSKGGRRKILGLIILGLTIASALAGYYLYKKYGEERAREPYRRSGLSEGEINSFLPSILNKMEILPALKLPWLGLEIKL